MSKQSVYASTKVISENGEILQEIVEHKFEREGLFVKLYLNGVDKLLGLDKTHLNVLLLFVKYMNMRNECRLIDVCDDGKYSAGYIRGRMKGLVEGGFVQRIKRGKYQVDLNLFSQTNYKKNLELKK